MSILIHYFLTIVVGQLDTDPNVKCYCCDLFHSFLVSFIRSFVRLFILSTMLLLLLLVALLMLL